jgi:hypothetical protein
MYLCLELGPSYRRGEDLTAYTVEPEETAIARQHVGKHFPAEKNTHQTIEKLLDVVFSMWPVPIKYSERSERKVSDYFLLKFLTTVFIFVALSAYLLIWDLFNNPVST